MTLAVKEDMATDPGDVGFLGPATVVAEADGRADAIEKAGFGWFGRAGLVQSGHEMAPATAGQHRIRGRCAHRNAPDPDRLAAG